MGPEGLSSLLAALPGDETPGVILGFKDEDDAGVFRLGDGLAIVQTVDLITPIVDDPYTFGQIATANSLSDIYAMGGTAVTALNIACFPCTADPGILAAIITGSIAKLKEAGVALLGGHTVQDDELKFGLSVTGTIHPDRIIRKAGAGPGDLLVLTKSIGVGVIATAIKSGKAPAEIEDEAIASMLKLNRSAAESAVAAGARAMTDVTGFGLIGHASEMAEHSKVTLELESGKVPLLPGALKLARAGHLSGGLRSNSRHYARRVEVSKGVSPDLLSLLYVPQTSGGLLIAMSESAADNFLKGNAGTIIGRVVEKQGNILIKAG